MAWLSRAEPVRRLTVMLWVRRMPAMWGVSGDERKAVMDARISRSSRLGSSKPGVSRRVKRVEVSSRR